MTRTKRLIAIVMCTLALALALPTTARADDYDLASTGVAATVGTDGSLTVTETRTVDFDGNFHGFYWQIPTGDGSLGPVTCTVSEAGEVDADGVQHPYTQGAFEDHTPGTWAQQHEADSERVDVHFDLTDTTGTFYVTYVLQGAVAHWQDTGELYWKFVGDQWDRASNDVAAAVYFAGAPEGTKVTAGENLRGWLHNRSAIGTIDVPSGVVRAWDDLSGGDPGTVNVSMDHVPEGEFGEVRVAFPAEWLPDMEASDTARLGAILDEEAKWAEDTNARMGQARLIATIEQWVLTALAVLTAGISARAFISYRATHRAHFDDKYFRDVPTDDHPAVLHYVETGGAGEGPDFTATLMRLSDQGVIRLEKATYLRKRLMGSPKQEEDWRLTLIPARVALVKDPIDKATLDFVFGYVAPRAQSFSDGNERPENTVLMSDFERVAAKDEDRYSNYLDLWKEAVREQVTARGLDIDEGANVPRSLEIMGLIDLVAIVITVGHLFFFTETLTMVGRLPYVVVPLVLLVISLVVGFGLVVSLPARSAEAVEVRAKLEALKRWLKEFTRLEEAVPTDVVLWNKLLVMAVILGVSDRVIEQLRLALPQIMEDAAFSHSAMWCDPGMGSRSPANAISNGFSSASSEASSSGSGGGASSGGGGGAGGGGGGAY